MSLGIQCSCYKPHPSEGTLCLLKVERQSLHSKPLLRTIIKLHNYSTPPRLHHSISVVVKWKVHEIGQCEATPLVNEACILKVEAVYVPEAFVTAYVTE